MTSASAYHVVHRRRDEGRRVIAVYQTPGSNALQLDREIRDRMTELAKRFPKGIAWAINYDTTTFVSASMHDVVITLGEALALVIAVVFLFLQSWRSTVIPAIAIPVSLIATLAVMLALGFSLNTVSMLGMVLAIGLVVDDAIVVVENVERQLEQGCRRSPPSLRRCGKSPARLSPRPPCCWRFRAGRLSAWCHRPAVQPVRADHRDLGRHLGIQFAHPQPGFVRRVAAASAAVALAGVPRLQRRFHLCRAGVREWHPACHRRALGCAGLFAAGLVLTYGIYSRIPAGFLPAEDQGYFFAVIQLPDAPRCNAPRLLPRRFGPSWQRRTV